MYELKDIEAGLRDMPMTPKSKIIHFSREAYAFHVEVTEYRSYIMLQYSVICLKYFSLDRKSTRLNSSHSGESRMPSSA